MCRITAFLAVLSLLGPARAWGETKIVTLKDGTMITGDVTETATGYTIKFPGGSEAAYRKDQVFSVQSPDSLGKEFEQKLSQANPNNADQLYDVAEWAFKRKLYEQAKQALEAALKANPAHMKAKYLLTNVNALLKAGPLPTQPGTTTRTTGGETTTAPMLAKEMYLGDEDINRIRLEELRKKEVSLTIEFRKRVLERFIETRRGKPPLFDTLRGEDKFRALTPQEQAYFMIQQMDRDSALRDDIRIQSDPSFLIEYRNTVWPRIKGVCAAPDCHGGAKPLNGLKFFNYPGTNIRADYTNFVMTVGFITKEGLRLADRSNPEESLLLNFGRPADQARYAHKKPLPKTLFPKRDSPEYKQVLAWIKSLKTPYPEYRLEYKNPLGLVISTGPNLGFLETQPAPTTEPSTPPAPTTTPAPVEPPKP
jgi:hypothetical protein